MIGSMTTTAPTTETAPAPAPTPTPAAPTAPPDWFATLPTDLQADKTPANFKGKGVDELAKSLVNAQKLIGTDKVAKPQPGWGEKEWGEFYDVVGRPKDASEYQLPEKLPEGVNITPESAKSFFEKAREMGLTKRQAAAVVEFHAQQVAEASKSFVGQQEKMLTEAKGELERRFGTAFNERMGLAKEALRFAGSDADREALLGNPLIANNPAIIELLANVGKAVASDVIIGKGSGYKPGHTPSEAQAEIESLRGDKEFMAAWINAHHPGHKAAVDRMDELYRLTANRR